MIAKSKTASALVVVLILARSLSASEESTAVDAARAFVDAERSQNYPAVVALTPPPLVQVQGGKEKILAALQATPHPAAVTVESASFPGDNAKIEATDALLYLIKADLTEVSHRKETRILLHTYYVVVRSKDNPAWYVLDGSTLTEIQLRRLFHGLPGKLALPTVTSEVVKDGP